MSTITNLEGSTPVTTNGAAAIINNNFDALNDEKLETSMLDTDTSLTANSDERIPSQKAVRAFVLSGGQANASETERGLVEEATDAEVTAGTATGSTGAKLFVTPAKLDTRLDTLLADYPTGNTIVGVSSTGAYGYSNFSFPFTSTFWTVGANATLQNSTTTHANNDDALVRLTAALSYIDNGNTLKFNSSKRVIVRFGAKYGSSAPEEHSTHGFYILGATATDYKGTNTTRVAFIRDAGSWYATVANGSATTETPVTVADSTVFNTFVIDYDPANTRALFYINGTLAATITTNLPTSVASTIAFTSGGGTNSGGGNEHQLQVTTVPSFSVQL